MSRARNKQMVTSCAALFKHGHSHKSGRVGGVFGTHHVDTFIMVGCVRSSLHPHYITRLETSAGIGPKDAIPESCNDTEIFLGCDPMMQLMRIGVHPEDEPGLVMRQFMHQC
jgi:hypothetical protein